MLIELADRWAVALSSVTWAGLSLLIGWRVARWPLARLERTGPVTTLRRWERSGRWWRRLGVHRWKDAVPDAGAAFGGVSKRALGSRSGGGLDRFRRETVRAERMHWLLMATTPLHLVWCRPAVAAGMVVFGIGFNAPFIVIQRYNRGRLDGLLARTRT